MSLRSSRYLTRKDLLAVLPVSRTTLWRWENCPEVNFPKPLRFENSRIALWKREEVEQYIHNRTPNNSERINDVAW